MIPQERQIQLSPLLALMLGGSKVQTMHSRYINVKKR